MEFAIDVENLEKSYGEGERRARVLRGLSMKVGRGRSAAVIGESGSGKSTLLRILGGLDADWRGGVRVCGEDLSAMSGERARRFRSSKVGFVFQSSYFLPQFTILENVLLPTLPHGGKAEARAMALLEEVGVARTASRLPSEVSGGELQRACVARALVNSPELLIADEPSGSLDAESARRLLELFERLNSGGLAIIMATHSAEMASAMSMRFRLSGGRAEVSP